MKYFYTILKLTVRSSLTFILLSLPIVIYLGVVGIATAEVPKYILILLSMVFTNSFFMLIIYRSIQGAIRAKSYKHLKKRLFYFGLLPLYIMLSFSVLIVYYFVANPYDLIYKLLLTWGYFFGFIFILIRISVLKLNILKD